MNPLILKRVNRCFYYFTAGYRTTKCSKLRNNCKLCKFITSITGARLSRKLRSLFRSKVSIRTHSRKYNIMNGNARFVMNEAGCKQRVHVCASTFPCATVDGLAIRYLTCTSLLGLLIGYRIYRIRGSFLEIFFFNHFSV